MSVSVARTGNILVIGFANPPVNALSSRAGVVEELLAEVHKIEESGAEAVVIHGEGRFYSAGADIEDFGENPSEDVRGLRTLVETVEALPIPVVMAIHGTALGGGLELALAGHYRVAAASTKFALPEVSLGLLPGAGGTQRMPRLIGAEAALAMILSGRPIDAAAARAAGFIDEVTEGDHKEAAIAAAGRLAGTTPKRASALTVAVDPAQIAKARAEELAKPRPSLARQYIVDCIEAAGGPFAEGLALEARLFNELMLSEPSRGLRHAFLAERAAQRIVGLDRTIKPGKPTTAAVFGAGTLGGGIALVLLNAGMPVTLIDADAAALESARAGIEQALAGLVEKGRIAAAIAQQRLAGLSLGAVAGAAGSADFAIEAVADTPEAKRQALAALDGSIRPEAILATSSATQDLDALAEATANPGRLVALRFLPPVDAMRLLEIARGTKTEPAVLATAMDIAKRINKLGVVAGPHEGSIGPRLLGAYRREAAALVAQGVEPEGVDRALEAWGMVAGPFSGNAGAPAAAATALTGSDMTDAEIVERCTFAMVNEGAKAIADGTAQRPGDIDVVLVHGYGFPAERGGPMFHADRVGLAKVLERVRAFAEPAPLLAELAGAGRSFQSLNG